MKINKVSFGLAGGILWGLGLFIITLISIATGYASNFLNSIANLYIGYSITFMGSIIGLIYGFLDGFIGLYIFAWLYNLLERNKRQYYGN